MSMRMGSIVRPKNYMGTFGAKANTKTPSQAKVGSICGPAIDFALDKKREQSPEIGISIVNEGVEEKPTFIVKGYFGNVKDDNDFATEPTDGKHLRFMLKFIGTRSDRQAFAENINKKIQDIIKGNDLGQPIYTDSYVCGSPKNSFYVVAYPAQADVNFQLDMKKMAKAIAGGVDENKDFKILEDGYNYQYTVSESEMKVTRQSTA